MTRTRRLAAAYIALAAAVAVLFALNLFWGSVSLAPGAVLTALLGKGGDALAGNIILQLRLPRAVMAALLGAALSAAGYLLQTFFANPIAGPFVMGVSSGAKLAVALTMVVFLDRGMLTSSATMIAAAFAGAMAAMAFVLAVARRVQRMSILVICGVMIGYICSAITDIVVAFCAGFQHRQSAQLVAGQLFRRDMGQCAGCGTGGAACAGGILSAFQAHGRLPDGRSICPQRGRECQAFLGSAGAAIQPAGGLRHRLCGADLLCRHRGAAPCQAAAGQRKAAACAAGVLLGRCGFLPVLRPAGPQSVRAHGAVHQLGHGRVRRTGGHLAAGAAQFRAGGRMMNEKALCTARELAIGYGKTPLLSDICLGAQPGQILTLIGPNGAGKSTLLKTLAGQLAPMGGTVLLAGKDLTAYTGTQRAQKLALMAPHSRRMELTTCFDFVSAGRYPYTGRLGILSAEDSNRCTELWSWWGGALADRDFNCVSDGPRSAS